MKRLFACFAVLTIATASIACSLAAEPKAKPESPPQVYKVLPRLEIDKLGCVQFYCSVSKAIWIEYNRSRLKKVSGTFICFSRPASGF